MAGYIGNKSSVVSSGAERKFKFTITETTTTLSNLAYTPNLVHVFHNGIRLVDGTDYTATNGTSIILTNAAENGDEVVVVSYASFQPSDTVSASLGGFFEGNVTVNADLTVSGNTDINGGTIDGTVIGGSTPASISGTTGTFSGNLTVDTNTLFVDAVNNRVGIGTSSPNTPLEVTGAVRATNSGTSGYFYRGYRSGTTSAWYVYDNGTEVQMTVEQANPLLFGTSNTERMRIDSAGRVTTPYQPLFIGRHNDLYSSTFTSGSIIPLTIVDVNIGSHWNPSTYRFTCPVTGIYECVGNDISISNQGASLGVFKNGTLQYRRYTEDRDKGVFGKLSCVTGDYLEFRIAEGSTTLFGDSGYAQYSIRLIG